MRIPWKKRDRQTGFPEERQEEAIRAFHESETELLSATAQAAEADRLANSLRALRSQNHFGLRMRRGIQEGLRHE